MIIMANFTPVANPTSAAATESGPTSEVTDQAGDQADAGQDFAALLAAWFAPAAAPMTPAPLPGGEPATGQAAYSFAVTSDQQASAGASLPLTLQPELLGVVPTLPASALAAIALPEAALIEAVPVPPPDLAVAAAAAAVSNLAPLPIPTGIVTSTAAPDTAPAQLEITDSADVTSLASQSETSQTGFETEAVKLAARVVKDILAEAETATSSTPEHTSGNASEAEFPPELSAREQASLPAPEAADSAITAPSLQANRLTNTGAPAASEGRNAPPPIIHQTLDPLLALAQQTSPRETRSLRFQLHPEELGRVDVEVTRDAAGRVSASLNADGVEAANTLTNGIGHLRAALEKAGVNVEHLDVYATPQFQHNNQSNQQQQSPTPRAAPTNHFGAEQISEELSTTVEEEKLLNLRA